MGKITPPDHEWEEGNRTHLTHLHHLHIKKYTFPTKLSVKFMLPFFCHLFLFNFYEYLIYEAIQKTRFCWLIVHCVLLAHNKLMRTYSNHIRLYASK